MFPDIWYIEALPLTKYTIVAYHTQMHPWLIALKDDIEKRGMLSPLLVDNREDKPYYIRHGNNRLQCLGLLGWTHAPCLCFGLEPDVDALKMESMEQCQEYLKDGIIGHNMVNDRRGFAVTKAMLPECCKYPE